MVCFIYKGGGWFAVSSPLSRNVFPELARLACACLELFGFLAAVEKQL